jgi:hypothetical protein
VSAGKPEDVVMPFGKFKGRTLGDILAERPSYLAWVQGLELRDKLREAVDAMCEKYDREINGPDED